MKLRSVIISYSGTIRYASSGYTAMGFFNSLRKLSPEKFSMRLGAL